MFCGFCGIFDHLLFFDLTLVINAENYTQDFIGRLRGKVVIAFVTGFYMNKGLDKVVTLQAPFREL